MSYNIIGFYALLAVLFFSQIGNSVSTIISIFHIAHPWFYAIAAVLGVSAGLGLFLIYIPDLKYFLVKHFESDQVANIQRILKYKKEDNSEDYIRARLWLHNNKNNNEDVPVYISSMAKDKIKKKVERRENRQKYKSSYDFVNIFGLINASTANLVNTLVGGALLLLSIFTIFKVHIATSSLLMLSCIFGLAGFVASATTTRSALKKAFTKIVIYKNYSLTSLLIAVPVTLAAVGNAFWGGLHLLSKLSMLLGKGSKVGLALLHSSKWVSVLIAVICATVTFFAAGSLYFVSVDKKLSSENNTSIKRNPLHVVFTIIASLSLTVIYAYRLDFLLKLIPHISTLLATSIAITSAVFMFGMFECIMLDKISNLNPDDFFKFDYSESDLTDVGKSVFNPIGKLDNNAQSLA